MNPEEISTIIRGSLYRVGLDRGIEVSRWFAVTRYRRAEVLVWRVDPLTFKLVRESIRVR